MIDNLPNVWKIEKLENISKIQAGGTPSRTKSEYWNGNIPWLKISNLKSKFTDKATEFITEEGLKNSSTKLFEENTILYTIFATLGEVSILKIKATTNQAIAGITITNSNVSLEYIYYYLKSIKEKVINEGRGVAQNNINLSILRNIEIPIPPLQQQEKIVKVLDLSSNLIEKQKELLKNYDLFLKSKFIEMFGDPITNPMDWEVVKCIDVADCIVPGRDKPKSFTGNIPWITTGDLKDKGIISKSKENIGLSQNEIKEVKAKLIPKNSVIFTCVGDLGICSIINEDIIMNQQLHSFQCKEKVNNIFLMFNITMQKSYMYKMATSTTVPYMNKTTCNNIPTILPPLELQNKFASIVEKIEIIKEKENQKLKQFEDLHNSMMNKAFKGDIK
ncbi:restriction endonuclease subunit S [Aliarcobacter butzleri]|uniref:restriction endonuclease subunit S n=1 Tax=Aliarcobacter butzleri TaxID=28197 RepID=UPI001EDB20F3|nr:restriction endonuclease subunit S [Aliarcobacter butzleri]MCG3653062.1 restriction endonuclease subunit S [Aliarcobacter butzleri]